MAKPPRSRGRGDAARRRPTPRCAVPSASPDTGLRDRDVLGELIATRGAVDGETCLGVYAEVLQPGVVQVGDPVELA